MILLDTSALIAGLDEHGALARQMYETLQGFERLAIPALVLYEWRRGPRTPLQLTSQQRIFPDAQCLAFGPEDAVLAAGIYRTLPRARARAMDIAIAAMALRHRAALWTLNPRDFEDIPGLRLA